MSFNFPTAPQVNRQQAMLAGGGAIVILAALGWFFFLRPANEAPAADTPAVSAGARARAAREAAIKKRQAAGGAPVAQAGATAPANAKDSAAAKAASPADAKVAAKGAAPKPGTARADSAALKAAAATPAPPTGAAKPAARDSAAARTAAAAAAQKDSNIVVMREDFAYEPAGRRDPFVSLMGTEDIGPVVADLTLTGILWHPTRPVAVLRQTTGQKQQYRVTIGSTLGRMRVTQIKPKTVIFTIEEFGFNRRDSLILGDTTQVRAR